ncbi:MAG: RNA polymerase Rpb4 family protein [Candidatus Micrarchaeia archaeon]|jgi:DNA-directed RNA polymerase subunit F
MIGKSILNKKIVLIQEALEILENRKKESELGYEQELAYEHAKKFSKLTKEKAEKLITQLGEIKKLSDEAKIKIVEILPKNEDTIRQILANEVYTLNEEEIKKIMEIINEGRKG